jgi:PKD repeat protein
LAQAGTVTCLPGTYTLTYTVTNDNGATVTATRAVIIYSAGQLSMQLPLYQNLDNGTAADLTVQALGNASSAEAAAAANSIASQLSSGSAAGLDVQPSDVTILEAQLVELGPSNFSVQVSVMFDVFFPTSVHRADIKSATTAAAAAAGTATRRALLSSPTNASFPATAGAALRWPTCSKVSSRRLESIHQQQAERQDLVEYNLHAMISSLRQLAAAVTAEARHAQQAALSKSPVICDTTAGCSGSGRNGRQLLQAADSGIAARLASMTAAASSSLGPVSMTGQQTSAAVDPVVVSDAISSV